MTRHRSSPSRKKRSFPDGVANGWNRWLGRHRQQASSRLDRPGAGSDTLQWYARVETVLQGGDMRHVEDRPCDRVSRAAARDGFYKRIGHARYADVEKLD
jgi:hypothetical protein